MSNTSDARKIGNRPRFRKAVSRLPVIYEVKVKSGVIREFSWRPSNLVSGYVAG